MSDLSIKELRACLKKANVSYDGVVEKSDYVRLVQKHKCAPPGHEAYEKLELCGFKAPPLPDKPGEWSAGPGGPRDATYVVKRDGVTCLMTYAETEAAMQAKLTALENLASKCLREMQVIRSLCDKAAAGSDARFEKVKKQWRDAEKERTELEIWLHKLTGELPAARVPTAANDMDGTPREFASAVVGEVEGVGGSCSVINVSDPAHEDAADLFTRAARDIMNGSEAVSFQDELDELAGQIASGRTGKPGWEIVRILVFEPLTASSHASASDISQHLACKPLAERAERVREGAALYVSSAIIERNRAESLAGLRKLYGQFHFELFIEAFFATSRFSEMVGTQHMARTWLSDMIEPNDVGAPYLYLWYLDLGGTNRLTDGSIIEPSSPDGQHGGRGGWRCGGGGGRGSAAERLKKKLAARQGPGTSSRVFCDAVAALTAVLLPMLSDEGAAALLDSVHQNVPAAAVDAAYVAALRNDKPMMKMSAAAEAAVQHVAAAQDSVRLQPEVAPPIKLLVVASHALLAAGLKAELPPTRAAKLQLFDDAVGRIRDLLLAAPRGKLPPSGKVPPLKERLKGWQYATEVPGTGYSSNADHATAVPDAGHSKVVVV